MMVTLNSKYELNSIDLKEILRINVSFNSSNYFGKISIIFTFMDVLFKTFI